MVNHDILLDKLNHYGIRGVANNWFESYLKGREQYVSVNGNYSSRKRIKYSVPQGNILGPLLFIIYIIDLPNISQLARYILYADDANIIITGDTIQEVHEKFNTVSSALIQWVRDNELLLNVKKTNYMIFTNRRHVDLGNVAFKMGETPIERSSVARFLGVLIDDKLTWNQHIMAVRHKMSRYIGSIFRIKHMLPMRCRLLTYNSLVMSHLNYCSLKSRRIELAGQSGLVHSPELGSPLYLIWRSHVTQQSNLTGRANSHAPIRGQNDHVPQRRLILAPDWRVATPLNQ